MVIKRLTNLFLLRGRLFKLILWFWEVFLSFLWWLLCWVMVDIPISLPSFSLPFSYSSFLFTLESSFSSDSPNLGAKWKKILDGSTGNQVMIIKRAELWIKLKFALSRLINFLLSRNNTNSQSSCKLKRRKKIIRPEDIVWVNTIFSKIFS